MWLCLKCHHGNPGPARLCNECLNVRTAELLQKSGFFSGDVENVANVTEAERSANADLDVASDCGGGVLSQPIVSGNACIICLSEPKVASLVHGQSGHQACCYQCALQLKKLRKPCPICRRPIDKVIRNFVV